MRKVFFNKKLYLFTLISVVSINLSGCVGAMTALMANSNPSQLVNLTGQGNVQNQQQKPAKNFLIDMDMNLTLLKQLAVITKFNELLLSDLPVNKNINIISVLNQEIEPKREEIFTNNLKNLAENDFQFYKLYNFSKYMDKSSQNSDAFSMIKNFAKKKAIESLINYLTTETERLKIAFINPNILNNEKLLEKTTTAKDNSGTLNMLIKNMSMKNSKKSNTCPISSKSLEEAINKSGGIDKFIETDLGKLCFKKEKKEKKEETFKEQFYSLLPPNISEKIKKLDEEIAKLTFEQKNIEGKIKDIEELGDENEKKKLKELQKKLTKIEEEIKKKEELRDKHYEEAFKYIETNPKFALSKVEKAKKLKNITEYVNSNLNKLTLSLAALTVKLFNDVKSVITDLKNTKNSYTAIVSKNFSFDKEILKANSTDIYKNRFTQILKDIIYIPKYYFKIVGYLWSQKSLVSKYDDYLNKIIETSEKFSRK